MTQKQEIELFKKVIEILTKGYGRNPRPHKAGIVLNCPECRASIACDILEEHIDLMKE